MSRHAPQVADLLSSGSRQQPAANPLRKPQFSRTRLTDAVRRQHSACTASSNRRRMTVIAAPSKYPDEVPELAIRLVRDCVAAGEEPVTVTGVCPAGR